MYPYYYDDNKPDAHVLVAVDDAHKVFFPIVCTYSGSSSAKIYLVSDIDTGISTLESRDVKYSITNGDVAKCAFLPLAYGADTTATEPEWAHDHGNEWSNEAEEFGVDIEFDATAFNAGGAFVEGVEDVSDDIWFEVFEKKLFSNSE